MRLVTLELRTARALLAGVGPHRSAIADLQKAIARAEALLVPRPWKRWGGSRDGNPLLDRDWPCNDTVAARVDHRGWAAYPRNPRLDSDARGIPLASGPETGEAGQRGSLADVVAEDPIAARMKVTQVQVQGGEGLIFIVLAGSADEGRKVAGQLLLDVEIRPVRNGGS